MTTHLIKFTIITTVAVLFLLILNNVYFKQHASELRLQIQQQFYNTKVPNSNPDSSKSSTLSSEEEDLIENYEDIIDSTMVNLESESENNNFIQPNSPEKSVSSPTLINLVFYDAKYEYGAVKMPNGNFGDELNKFIVKQLLNSTKYTLAYNLQNSKDSKKLVARTYKNLICIGSYMNAALTLAPEVVYIYGTGTIQSTPAKNKTTGLIPKNYGPQVNIFAVRGPKTFENLKLLGHQMPATKIYGDPGGLFS